MNKTKIKYLIIIYVLAIGGRSFAASESAVVKSPTVINQVKPAKQIKNKHITAPVVVNKLKLKTKLASSKHAKKTLPRPVRKKRQVINRRLVKTTKPTLGTSRLPVVNRPRPVLTIESNATRLVADKVILNFENADVKSVIKAISKLSGKNFLIDPNVRGTVNIVSETPVSRVDSYKILEAALRMQGFASVQEVGSNIIKVLPEASAKEYNTRLIPYNKGVQNRGSLSDQIITKVFVVKHGSALQMANTIRPLIAPNNSLAVYPSSNAIIVTDYASNLSKISQIISQLNKADIISHPDSGPIFVPLHAAVATDIAEILTKYIRQNQYGDNRGSGPMASVSVEPITNSLIISSSIPGKAQELKKLALKLDENIEEAHSDLHVVYLKNADAAHVADVLRVIAYGQEDPNLSPTSKYGTFDQEPTSTFTTGGSTGGGSPVNNVTSVSAKTYRGGTGNPNEAPKILIQAEPTTNSLIIQAPGPLYRNMRMVIRMLDVRRAQIMIEAMVADINSTKSGSFGIQWFAGGGNDNVGAFSLGNYNTNNPLTQTIGAAGALSAGGAGAATALGQLPQDVVVGVVSGSTTIDGHVIPSLGALANIISAKSSGNIISRPTLITLDNEQARIFVGENIGITSGTFTTSAGGANNPYNQVDRKDLGTVLSVKPLITENGTIQLNIYQEDSKVDPGSLDKANPTILKRSMRTNLLVDDGQIIALGGMTSDEIQLQKRGIPILSDIPILGNLFKWQSRQHVRQNLVLFLRPIIIKNEEGYKALTNERYRYILDAQKKIAGSSSLVVPEVKAVTLDNQLPYKSEVPNQHLGSDELKSPLVDNTVWQTDPNDSNVIDLTNISKPTKADKAKVIENNSQVITVRHLKANKPVMVNTNKLDK